MNGSRSKRQQHRISSGVRRRSFLLGGMGAALWLPFLASRKSRAAQTIPEGLNFLILTWPIGIDGAWQPTSSNGSLTMHPTLAPLQPFADRMLFIDGLDTLVQNNVNAHNEGTVSLYTGSTNFASFTALSRLPSIDQIIADQIGDVTPYRSIHLGCLTNTPTSINTPFLHYKGDGQALAATDDPNILYGDLLQLTMGAESPELAELRARRKSVIDFLGEELAAVRSQVSRDDLLKIDEHVEGVRALEKQIADLECGTPPPPEVDSAQVLNNENFEAVFSAQTQLMALALQCGMTRVATLQLSNSDSRFDLVDATDTCHYAAHFGSDPEDPLRYSKYFMERVADVLATLDATPVDGETSLLDNTVVLMSSEMAHPSHAPDSLPFFIAGGTTHEFFKRGQMVDASGSIHTRALTSVVHAFGVEVESVGESSDPASKGSLDDIVRA